MKNPIFPFTGDDHAVMLADQVRLEAFKRAIQNQVKEGMTVVEVGTGTGILSAFAAEVTKAPIVAIEFNPEMAKIARKMMSAAHFDQVEIKVGKSQEVELTHEPAVLVTETIGALGPEEHTIEICHDLKKRYPSLKKIIPSRLKVLAEGISSQMIQDQEKYFFHDFESASFGTFRYEAIHEELHQAWTGIIRFGSLSHSKTVGEARVLVDYILGEVESPVFETIYVCDENPAIDAVHLYFEAELDPEIILSTHFSEPETHWRNAYVPKPKDKKRLQVSYLHGQDRLKVKWLD